MNCHEFEERLNDVLDRRLAPRLDPDLCAHARQCAACAPLLAAGSLFAQGGFSAPRPSAPRDLSAAVLAQWRRLRLRRTLVSSALAAAAATLLAAAWLNLAGAPGRRPVEPLAGTRPAPPGPGKSAAAPSAAEQAGRQPGDPPAAVLGIGSLARRSTDRYLDLARQTSRSVAEAVQALPMSDAPAEQGVAPGPPRAPARSAVADDMASFKPLARSTLGAFDFFLGVLPGDAPAQRSSQSAPAESPSVPSPSPL